MKKRKMRMGRSLVIVRKFFPKVTTVEDATREITIEVTKRDASTAQARDHAQCAMAVACKRAMDLDGVIIAIKTAYLVKGTKALRYMVPESVQREIVSFDRGAAFAPGEYRLRRPEPSTRIGTEQRTGRNGGGTGGEQAAARRHFTEGVRAVVGSRRAVRALP
jgi:hypothetical protein